MTVQQQQQQHMKKKVKVPCSIDKIINSLRRPTRLWWLASTITVACVGIFSKIFIGLFNKTRVYNKHVIDDALDNRRAHVPLITVSNHHSCFDDPGMWGTLDLRHLLRPRRMRWSLAAHDICFTTRTHSAFFVHGKCVPVVRGAGVYQPSVDFCVERLRDGDWVHVFPEGKVNVTKEIRMRLKWGVGRMIYESPVTPIVVPVWHLGMDDVLPNEPPYYLRTRKHITFNYGRAIDFRSMVAELRRRRASDVEARKTITDAIEVALYKLKEETERLHNNNNNNKLLSTKLSSKSSSL